MRAYRTDKNQKDIVNALRKVGYVVQHLHSVGAGCPDILVGAGGLNILIEIKEGDGKLTPDQVTWHAVWKGQVSIARTPDEALEIVKNAIEQKTEKKATKSKILVATNDSARSGVGTRFAANAACGTDEVQGGNSRGSKLAHNSGEIEYRDGSRAKIWTRFTKPRKGTTGDAEGSGET